MEDETNSMMAEDLKVCALVGVLEPDTLPFEAYLLAGKILDVVERDHAQEVYELQQEKKAEGDEAFYSWHIPLDEFLASKDQAYLAEVRRRVGR